MVLKVASGGGGTGPNAFQGTWDANANNPFLQSGVGFNGEYYIVSTAGNTTLDGISNWQVGDWAIFNGVTNTWEKISGGNSGITITNDSTGNVNYNLALTNVSSGTITNEFVDNGNFVFNPSTSGLGITSGNNTITITPSQLFLKNSGIYINNYDNDPDGTPAVYGQAIIMDGGWGGFYFNTANVVFGIGNASFAVNQFGAISVGPRTLAQLQAGQGFVGSAGQVLTSQGGSASPTWTTPANGTVVSISAGTGITATPNPITSTGTIAIANTTVTAATYGSSSSVAQVTINAQGQVTSASNVGITIPSGNVTGLGTMATQNANAVVITGGTINSVSHTGGTFANANITSVAATFPNSYLSNSSATLGNTVVTLGSTVTSVGNLTLANANITSVASTFPNSYLANSSATIGNTTVTLGSTVTNIGNLTLANANITSVAATFPNSYLANSSVTLGNTTVSLGGTASSIGNLTLANVTITSGSISNVAVGAAITTKTGAYTATGTDETILANASSGAFSVTLPTAVGATGKTYIVKKIDSSANAVTVATTSSQTIDGATTRLLSTQYDAIQVQGDGANWFIIANTFGRNGTSGSF